MKVAVNLLWLVPGVVGGTEGYATGLLRGLAERSDPVDLTLFVLPDFLGAHPDLGHHFRTVVAPLPAGRHVLRRVTLETSWLGRRLRAARPDLTHHLGGVVPLGTPGPAAVTLHDLQYRHFPEYFSTAKRRYLSLMTEPSLRRASVVMTPSAFTRDDVAARVGIARHRLRVVPPRTSHPVPVSVAARAETRAALGLDGPFLLYPAATYRHKDHLVLVEAFARVADAAPTARLVLSGASGAGAWGSAASTLDQLRHRIGALGLTDRVLLPGYLPRAQLDALLAEAAALAFPSRFEGYGLPVLEAMAAGCPVLAADATALPEVLGRGADSGGQLLPPGDVGAWAGALLRVLTDGTERTRLASAGRARAARLMATDPVDALLSAYRAATGPATGDP